MMQFSIRSLFVVILAAALFLGIAQTAGYVAVSGIVVAASLLAWAVFRRRGGLFICCRIVAAVFALVAIWFFAVDWSWFAGDCPDCGRVRIIGQYRVLGMPVHTQVRDSPSEIEVILDDLGVPCEHANREQRDERRFWGLVLSSGCCDIILVDGPEDYTDENASKVKRWGAENAELAAALHDTVVLEHDYTSFWEAIDVLTGNATEGAE